MQDIQIPKAIYLYDEGIKDLDFGQIKNFIKNNFGNIKIYLIRLKEEIIRRKGIFFDFLCTQKNFQILEYAKESDSCHIILTNRLFATVDIDNKPHIRPSVYGYPSVISTSGIVEGPAKPKEYYLYKQKYIQLGIWEIEEQKVKCKFKGRFIDYNDAQLVEVLKGYISQALFFYITGKPFCDNRSCRLYNAHWQEDLIYSQIKSGKFCTNHKNILNKVKKKQTSFILKQ